MEWIRSLFFNVFFFLWTFLCVVLTLPGLVLPSIWILKVARLWGLGTHLGLRFFIGITYEIRGLEKIPSGAVIFASKHQSTLETTMIPIFAPTCAIILKKELLWIPLLGRVLRRSGVIAIDRSHGKKILPQLIAGARTFIADNRPIFIYPEGTRTPAGAVSRYKPGIFQLYHALGVPVVPIALNTGYFWGRRAFLKHPGHIVYEVLDPLPVGMGEKEFMAELERRVESACAALVPSSLGLPARELNSPRSKKSRAWVWSGIWGVLFGGILGGYWLFWNHQVTVLKEKIAVEVEKWQAKGSVFHYDRLDIGGFPFQIRLLFSRPSWKIQRGFLPVQAFFQGPVKVTASLWSLTKFQVRSDDPVRLSLFSVGGPLLEIGQFRWKQKGGTGADPLSSDTFLIMSKIQVLHLGDLFLALDSLTVQSQLEKDVFEAATKKVNLDFSATHIRGPSPKERSSWGAFSQWDQILMRLELKGVSPALLKPSQRPASLVSTVQTWQEQGGVLEVKNITLIKDQLHLILEGTLALDKHLQPEGAFTVGAQGLMAFLDTLYDQGFLNQTWHRNLKTGFRLGTAFLQADAFKKKKPEEESFRGVPEIPSFSLPSINRGSQENAEADWIWVPLSLQDRELSIGPFPLLHLPRLEWSFIQKGAEQNLLPAPLKNTLK